MTPLTPEIIEWIELNAKADTSALRLKHAGDKAAADAIMQIECRRKAATKLSDTLCCRSFYFPTNLSAEQCTSDAIAGFHSTLVRGSSVLDMTAGLCIDAFHIAGNGRSVTAIDINPEIAQAAASNAAALGISGFEAICADSTRWLAEGDRSFDTIFIDPARRGQGGRRTFALADCEPNVVALLPLLKQRCRRLIVKASPMLDICEVWRGLGESAHIYIIGTPTECKELVAVIDFDSRPGAACVTAVTVSRAGISTFSFTRSGEEQAQAAIAPELRPGMLLFEPSPAAMKSGAFNLMATRFGIGKLQRHTHLYAAQAPAPGFPGATFTINEVMPFNKAACKVIRSDYPVINVTARNFVLSSADLVKKLKIKEGGTMRLFAASAAEGPVIIIASPYGDI